MTMRPASMLLLLLLALVAALGWFVACGHDEQPGASAEFLANVAAPGSSKPEAPPIEGVALVQPATDAIRDLPDAALGPLEHVRSVELARVVVRFVDEAGAPARDAFVYGLTSETRRSDWLHWHHRFSGQTDAQGTLDASGRLDCREVATPWKPGPSIRFEVESDGREFFASAPMTAWARDPQRVGGGLLQLGTLVLRPVGKLEYVTVQFRDMHGTPVHDLEVALFRGQEWLEEAQSDYRGSFLIPWCVPDDELDLRIQHARGFVHKVRVRRGSRDLVIVLPIDLRMASLTLPVLHHAGMTLQSFSVRLETRGRVWSDSEPEFGSSRLRWTGLPPFAEYRATLCFDRESLTTTDWIELGPGEDATAPALDVRSLVQPIRLRVLGRTGAGVAGAQIIDDKRGQIATTDASGLAAFVLTRPEKVVNIAVIGYVAIRADLAANSEVVLERAPLTRIAVPQIEHGSEGTVEAWLEFELQREQEDPHVVRTVTFKVELAVGQTTSIGLPFDSDGRVTQLACRGRAWSVAGPFEPRLFRRIDDQLEFDWPVELLSETFRAFLPR